MNNPRLLWRLCCVAAIGLCVLCYSPLVLASNPEPYLFGIPRTLWAGFLISVALVALTYVGTRVHPGRWQEDHE